MKLFQRIHGIKTIHIVLYLVTVVLSTACARSEQAWETKNISGLLPDLSFHLTDAGLERYVTEKQYQGNILLLYFGYTQCPDVCSTTMIRLSNAILALGGSARQVRLLFVSVDPKRDTEAVLKKYVHAFGEQVVGLRGVQDELQSLTKRYRVTYGYGKADENGNYNVSHSSAVYVFDRHEHVRLLIRSTDSLAAIERDLERLLGEKAAS